MSCTPADSRRRDDQFRIGIALEAGDVLRHRSGEQLDVLRQVADMAGRACRDPTGRAPRRRAGCGRGPAAQAPMTARTSDDLPAPLGPMTPRPLPAVQREADIDDREARWRRAAPPRGSRSRAYWPAPAAASASPLSGNCASVRFEPRASPGGSRRSRASWRPAARPAAGRARERIEAAMMMPKRSLPARSPGRHRGRERRTGTVMRKIFETPAKPPDRSMHLEDGVSLILAVDRAPALGEPAGHAEGAQHLGVPPPRFDHARSAGWPSPKPSG